MTEEEQKAVANSVIERMKEKKKYGLSKLFTIIIVGLILFIGIIGSFKNSFIEIDKYIEFLKSFGPIIMSLIGSIGVGTAAKNVMNGRNKK